MILKRFYSNSIIEFNLSEDITIIPANLEKSVEFDEINMNKISGMYDILDKGIYSVFSLNNSNYLFLKNQTIEITESIDFEYKVNWKKNELSYFEVFKHKKAICKIEYYNPYDPLINPLDGDEDWLYVNWAYHMATYIKKVKENPGLILFPNDNNKKIFSSQ